MLHAAALVQNGGPCFRQTRWTWRPGEQWAILGADDSGRSLLVDAILGLVPLVRGEMCGAVFEDNGHGRTGVDPIAPVSPRVQRQIAEQESSFYQSRWHHGLHEGERTVSRFLSWECVQGYNPFQVDAPPVGARAFGERRQQLTRRLRLGKLLRSRLVCLSNGEMRRTLLVHALLKSPRLLVLEDAYAGLDLASRGLLRRTIDRWMASGGHVLFCTSREEDLPSATSHLLLVRDHRIEGQGTREQMLPIWRAIHRLDRDAPSLGGGRRRPAPRSGSPRTGTPLIELQRVSITLGRRRILREVTWTVREGECWALLGPNGAGKTTLLNLIQGDHPQAYARDIRLFGQSVDSTQTLWEMRQRLGWLSPELHQHYPEGWSALDVVCSGFFNSIGLYQPCSRRQLREGRRQLAALGLARLARSSFGALSFGNQRLVLFARAMVKRPPLLILDEPCQGLDSDQRRLLLGRVDQLVAETGCALIFVTHRPHEMPTCVSRTLRLAAGRVSSTE